MKTERSKAKLSKAKPVESKTVENKTIEKQNHRKTKPSKAKKNRKPKGLRSAIEATGFEPAASSSRTQRSTKLSHASILIRRCFLFQRFVICKWDYTNHGTLCQPVFLRNFEFHVFSFPKLSFFLSGSLSLHSAPAPVPLLAPVYTPSSFCSCVHSLFLILSLPTLKNGIAGFAGYAVPVFDPKSVSYSSAGLMTFHTMAAIRAPTSGPAMKTHTQARASPPIRRAGPRERAGLTLVPVRPMPSR